MVNRESLQAFLFVCCLFACDVPRGLVRGTLIHSFTSRWRRFRRTHTETERSCCGVRRLLVAASVLLGSQVGGGVQDGHLCLFIGSFDDGVVRSLVSGAEAALDGRQRPLDSFRPLAAVEPAETQSGTSET